MAKARRSRKSQSAEETRLLALADELFVEIERGMRGYMLLMLELHYTSALRQPRRGSRKVSLGQFFRPRDYTYPCRRITPEATR